MFDDSLDGFVDLTGMQQQQECSGPFDELFDELFGDENAPVASVECCGDNSTSGILIVNDQWNQLSDWAL